MSSPDPGRLLRARLYERRRDDGDTHEQAVRFVERHFARTGFSATAELGQGAEDARHEAAIDERMGEGGRLRGGVSTALQGLSLGSSDELGAAVRSIPAVIPGGESYGEAFSRNVDLARGGIDDAREAFPAQSLTTEIAGAAAPFLLTGGVSAPASGAAGAASAGRLAGAGRTLARVAQTPVRGGALLGGAYAAGTAEGNPLERLDDAAIGAGTGAAAGSLLVGASRLAAPVASRAVDLVRPQLSRLAESRPALGIQSVKDRAVESLANAMERAGLTSDALAKAAREARPGETVMDVAARTGVDRGALQRMGIGAVAGGTAGALADPGDSPVAASAAALAGAAMGRRLPGNAVSRLARAAQSVPSEGSDRLGRFLGERAAGTASRVRASTESRSGRTFEDTVERVDDLRREARSKAAPLYREAMEETVDPLAGTRVVDESGAPRRVFHGTGSAFDEFDIARSESGVYGRGGYFTDDAAEAGGDGIEDLGWADAAGRFGWVGDAATAEQRLAARLDEAVASGKIDQRRADWLLRKNTSEGEAFAQYGIDVSDIIAPREAAPNVRPARLALRNPFGASGTDEFPAAEARRIFEVAGLPEHAARVREPGELGVSIYGDLSRELGPDGANEALRRAGFDGLRTRVKGGPTGRREWFVAFDNEQILPAFGDVTRREARTIDAPELRELAGLPRFQEAYDEGRRIASIRGTTLPELGEGPITVEAFDYMKRGLDAIIEKGLRGGTMAQDEARALSSRLRSVRRVVDEQVPKYREARDTFRVPARMAQFMEAARQGSRKLGLRRFTDEDPRILRRALDDMTPDERDAYIGGALDDVRRMLESSGRGQTRDIAADLTRRESPEMLERIRLLLDDDASFSAFMDDMGRERGMAETRQFVTGGSPTASIQAEQGDLAAGALPRLTEMVRPGNLAMRALDNSMAGRLRGLTEATVDELEPFLTTPLDQGGSDLILQAIEAMRRREAQAIPPVAGRLLGRAASFGTGAYASGTRDREP